MNNYIPDRNRFKLAAPPQWFLRKLWDYDSSLVIIPSRQNHMFRLAQRRPLTLTMKWAYEMMGGEADSSMMAGYGLVPITTILSTINWSSPLIWAELNDRSAGWRKGMREVDNILDRNDRERQERINRDNDTINDARARDGYRLYKTLSGQRTFIDGSKRFSPPPPSTPSRTEGGLIIPSTPF